MTIVGSLATGGLNGEAEPPAQWDAVQIPVRARLRSS